MSTRQKFSSVPDYLAALDGPQAKALRRVLTLVQKAVPGAKRGIHYGIPGFRRDRVFFYCAAFKGHIGIYPPVHGDARLQQALKPYANAKGNLRFPLDAPLPETLITRTAKALAAQYAAAPQKRSGSGGRAES